MPKPAARKRSLEDGSVEAPPKRRRTEPKPRTTSYLDLTKDAIHIATEQKAQLDVLLKVLRKRRKIVVVAGAGISVSAGSMTPKKNFPTHAGRLISDLRNSSRLPLSHRLV
jgi:hypothetical protein